jgi:hypothetical protein
LNNATTIKLQNEKHQKTFFISKIGLIKKFFAETSGKL